MKKQRKEGNHIEQPASDSVLLAAATVNHFEPFMLFKPRAFPEVGDRIPCKKLAKPDQFA